MFCPLQKEKFFLSPLNLNCSFWGFFTHHFSKGTLQKPWKGSNFRHVMHLIKGGVWYAEIDKIGEKPTYVGASAGLQGSKWVFAENLEKCVTHWRLLPAHIAQWGLGSWEKLGNPRKLRKCSSLQWCANPGISNPNPDISNPNPPLFF